MPQLKKTKKPKVKRIKTIKPRKLTKRGERQREINTVFKLGCSRMTITKLVGTEITIIITFSLLVLVLLLWLVDYNSSHLVRTFFIQ